MIRVRRGLIRILVAVHAVGGNGEEDHLPLCLGDVTAAAVGDQVCSIQRKPGELMVPRHGRPVDEAPGGVALGAVDAQFTVVQVAVARHAGWPGVGEVERLVAGAA
jgi:hypothetical protein